MPDTENQPRGQFSLPVWIQLNDIFHETEEAGRIILDFAVDL